MQLIRIACSGAGFEKLSALHELQGQLKTLSVENYEKLKNEIIETGFAFPIRVWADPESGRKFIVGGHQTTRTLKKMQEEGWEVPELPCTYIQAATLEQAKRRVLQDVSQYGKVEQEQLYQFMVEADFKIEDVVKSFEVPNVDLTRFADGYFKELATEQADTQTFTGKGKNPIEKLDNFLNAEIKPITIYFDKDQYEMMIQKLDKLCEKYGVENYSDVVLDLVSKAYENA